MRTDRKPHPFVVAALAVACLLALGSVVHDARARAAATPGAIARACDGAHGCPSKILLSRRAGLDTLDFRGAIALPDGFAPDRHAFAVVLSNEQGEIFAEMLEAGALRRSDRRWIHRDLAARRRGGIGRLELRPTGQGRWFAHLIAYEDLAAATLPSMTVQLVLDPQVFELTATWSERAFGWMLHTGDEPATTPTPGATATPPTTATPTPTPTVSPSPTPTRTPTPTPGASPTPTPTASPSPTPRVECATTTLTVTIGYDSSDPVTGVSVFLGYPGGRLNIIDEALSEQVTNASGVNGTFLVADNDTDADGTDDQLAIGLLTAGQGIPQGSFAQVLYDCVSGTSRPVAQDFTCAAEIVTLFGSVPGTCSVSALQYPPYMCNGQVATIVGTDDGETINGTANPDVIVARGGNDTITALGQNDVVCGGPGNDTIDGGPGGDILFGNSGDDTINGAGGTDTCYGGPGNDTLSSCETAVP